MRTREDPTVEVDYFRGIFTILLDYLKTFLSALHSLELIHLKTQLFREHLLS